VALPPVTRPTSGDPANDGSDTDATVVIDALADRDDYLDTNKVETTDSRLSDERTPSNASVTDAKIATTLSASKITGTAVVNARTISTTAPLAGGGDLSANRTLTIADGTTSVKGAVQLTDSISSTSTTTAATPNSVKTAYDLAGAAVPKSTVTTAGDLILGTGASTVTRLAAGTSTHVLTANGAGVAPSWQAAAGGSSTARPTESNGITGRVVSSDPVVMSTPPTVTLVADTGATTISGATRRLPSRDGTDFTYLGATYANVGTVNSYTNCYRQTGLTITTAAGQIDNLLRFEFETDTDQLEVLVRSEDSTHAKYRLWVDGELVTASESAVIGASGSWFRVKVVFASATNRRVTFEGQEMTFGGMFVVPTRSLWPTSRDIGPKVIVIGDSYGTSFDTDVKWVWDSYAVVAGRLLNWNVNPSCVSGTGYVATAGGTEVAYGTRFAADVTALAPDIVVFTGGLNDNAVSPLTTVQTAITSLFAAAKAALPAARFFVLSPFRPTDTYYTSLNTISGYLYAQSVVNGFNFIGTPIEYISGTGTVAAPTGVGNSDIYTLADTYHLNPAGYEYLGRHLAADIQDASRDYWATDRLGTMAASKRGLVPAPAASPSATKYLTETGTWATVSSSGGTTITACRAYRSAGLTGQTGLVQFGFDTHDYIDVAGYHSTSTNNARFKAPAAGRYRMTAQIALSNITAAGAIIGIDKNDSGNFIWQQLLTTVVTGALIGQVVAQVTTGWINLALNDYVAVSAFCDDLSWDVGDQNCWVVFERAV
jgi:lysophospholipase L1-like esterase